MLSAATFAYINQLLTELPGMIQAGVSIKNAISESTAVLGRVATEQREINQEEWDQLHSTIAGLRAELHAGEAPASGPVAATAAAPAPVAPVATSAPAPSASPAPASTLRAVAPDPAGKG